MPELTDHEKFLRDHIRQENSFYLRSVRLLKLLPLDTDGAAEEIEKLESRIQQNLGLIDEFDSYESRP